MDNCDVAILIFETINLLLGDYFLNSIKQK